MEDLQSAARAAKERADQRYAEQQEQDRIRAERDQAWRLDAERETRERALQFSTIMRAKNVPYTGLYDTEVEVVRSPGGYWAGVEVVGLKGEPKLLGWVAIHEREIRDSYGDWMRTEPGAFIASDGQTYKCNAERSYEGVRYITTADPDATILAGEERWQRMVHELARLEITN